MDIKVLLTGAFKYSEDQISKIKSLGYNIIFVQDEREKLNIDVSDIDAVVCNNLFMYNDIKEFKNLKFIQLTSAGLDRVPLEYINEKGIMLKNARGVYSVPMAEWIILKILEIYKDSNFFIKNQEKKRWVKKRKIYELTNKNIGIIGFGDVGSEVAKRLKAFKTNLIAINRSHVESKNIDEVFPIEDLHQVLPRLDIIILSIGLTSETQNMIGENEIELMKNDSILINVARGELITESELIRALNNEKFLGVALDVFENEPLERSPLWSFQNVIVTPHNSFVSENNNDRLFEIIFNNLKDI